MRGGRCRGGPKASQPFAPEVRTLGANADTVYVLLNRGDRSRVVKYVWEQAQGDRVLVQCDGPRYVAKPRRAACVRADRRRRWSHNYMASSHASKSPSRFHEGRPRGVGTGWLASSARRFVSWSTSV